MRNEIRLELQKLDERWTKVKKIYADMVDFTSSIYTQWTTCESSLKNLEEWLDDVNGAISQEKNLKRRNGQSLNEFLTMFKVSNCLYSSIRYIYVWYKCGVSN